MKTGTKLQEVTDLLDRIRPVNPGWYTLYAKDKQVCLVRFGQGYDRDTLIIVLAARDINEGLILRRWDQVEARIGGLIQKGFL